MKLPDLQVPVGGTDVGQAPYTNPGRYGSEGAAISGVGGDIANFAFNLMEKRKQASDADFAMNNAMKDTRDLAAYQDQLELKMPRSYAGFSDSVNQWINDRYQQNQENAPTETAKQLYQNHAGPVFNSAIIEARAKEYKNRALDMKQNLADNVDLNSNQIIQSASEDLTRQLITQGSQAIDNQHQSGVITAQQTYDLKQYNGHSGTMALLDSYHQKGNGADPKVAKVFFQKALDLLQGKATGSFEDGMDLSRDDLRKNLGPKELAAQIERFQNALDVNAKVNLNELESRTKDTIANAMEGRPADVTVFKDWNEVAKNDSDKMPYVIRHYTQYLAADAVGKARPELTQSSPSEWDAIIKKHDDKIDSVVEANAKANPDVVALGKPGFAGGVRIAEQQYMEGAKAQIMQARDKDPAQFTLDAFPGLKTLHDQAASGDPAATSQYLTRLKAMQDHLGFAPTNQRLITKAESNSWAIRLNGANPEQVNNNFSMFLKQYGKDAPTVVNNMVKDGNVDPKIWSMSYIDDQYQRQRAFGTFINGKASDEAFSRMYSPTDKKDLHEEVASQTADIYSAFAKTSAMGGGTEQANAITDLIEGEAKNQMIQGNKDPKLAVQSARKIFDANWAIVNSSNSTVPVPRVIGGRPVSLPLVEAFMYSHMQGGEATASLGADPIPGEDGKYLGYNIAKFGQWVPSPAKDGLRLNIKLSDGRIQPVLKNGAPLEFKYRDIVDNADKYTLDQVGKGSLRRTLEMLPTGLAK